MLISSTSTDGVDGNTTCSGAFIENNSFNLQKISSYLKNNDSNSAITVSAEVYETIIS